MGYSPQGHEELDMTEVTWHTLMWSFLPTLGKSLTENERPGKEIIMAEVKIIPGLFS